MHQNVDVLFDPVRRIEYLIGGYLGQGSFGTCFRVTNTRDNRVYACKQVNKEILVDQNSSFKLQTEISIHITLTHKNVLYCHGSFEDEFNTYIVLELCNRGSMSELLYRRQYLSNPEVRYYMKQIIAGVEYLHEKGVIHRDLKIGNLMLTDTMSIKIADFGLAARVKDPANKRFSSCGTPNYIAPEVIDGVGYSFEVDVWSLGCVLYTLLVGKPPFVAKNRELTFRKIRSCQFPKNNKLNMDVRKLLHRILQYEPSSRPRLSELLNDHYFKTGFTPNTLPTSALHVKPALKEGDDKTIKKVPLADITNKNCSKKRKMKDSAKNITKSSKNNENTTKMENTSGDKFDVPEVNDVDILNEDLILPPLTENSNFFNKKNKQCVLCTSYKLLDVLQTQISAILTHENTSLENESSSKAEITDKDLILVSRWAEHGDSVSGFGYNISNGALGVIFSDLTYFSTLSNGEDCIKIKRNGSMTKFVASNVPEDCKGKIKALDYFKRSLDQLNWTGVQATEYFKNEFIFVVDVRRYDNEALVMFLSTGSLQINFLQDHIKIILNPVRQIITKVTRNEYRTFSMQLFEKYGLSTDLSEVLKYCLEKITDMNKCRSHGLQAHRKKAVQSTAFKKW